jgi:hypothetical protein
MTPAQNLQDAPPVAPSDTPIQAPRRRVSASNPDAVTDFRLAMWRGGYSPLPCSGKRPAMNEWQRRHDTNEAEILLWDKVWPYDRNTGCLTRNTPTLDVDIADRNACRAVFEHIKGHFEGRGLVLCRSGNVPKFTVPFRTSTPFKKFEAKLIAPSGKMKLEFLGDGQQFVVAGIHPDTGAEYRWWPADRNPSTVARGALPNIDEERARTLVDDLVELLIRDFGFKGAEGPKERAGYVPRGDGPRRAPRAVQASVDGLIRVVLQGEPGERMGVSTGPPAGCVT